MGAATNFNLLPAADTGIVILTNAFPVGAAEALGMMYMDMVLYGEVTRDWVSGYGSAFERETAPIGSLAGLPFPAAPTPPLALNAYTGTYANGYFGDAQVADSGGSLVLSMGPAGAQEQIPLKHWDGNVFVFEPGDEMAAIGSRSAVTFTPSPTHIAESMRIELYDKLGPSTLVRR